MKKTSKVLLLGLCAVLLVTASVFGTVAYLTDTESVKNTFTVGNIDITLDETEATYKMIPGYTITKDPKVTVKTGSEPCWLFVKLEKSQNFDKYMEYTVDGDWTQGSVTDGIPADVYYREIDTADKMGKNYIVLKDNKVTVKSDVTKAMMDDAENNKPTLTITAYACQLQKDNNNRFTAPEAWEILNQTTTP